MVNLLQPGCDIVRPSTAKRKAPGKCITKYCRNKAAEGKRFCAKCRMRRWRANNPISAAYQALIGNARKRRIHFGLTAEQFKKWAEAAGLYVNGKRQPDLHIDRVDATKGYVLGNIQVLNVSENVIKGNYERRHDYYQANRWTMLSESSCGCCAEADEPF